MKRLTRLVLSIIAPWGSVIPTNYWTLPGIEKSTNGLRWIHWGSGDGLFHQIQESFNNDWSSIYLKLLAANTEDIKSDPDEMGRYYNNIAVAAHCALEPMAARDHFALALASGATEKEVTGAFTHNSTFIQ